MPDKYDDAIDYLTANPAEITGAWLSPETRRAGCLFQFATGDGLYKYGTNFGCLTQIRSEDAVASTMAMTLAIRDDKRLPACCEDVTVAHLSLFAEWQRRLDRELQRN